ncbi:hypothetical protein ACROYT_G022443 [Oculina patagonica]
MAEGGGYFGHEDPELDRLIDNDGNDDDDDEQEVNTTKAFQPGRASTPYPGEEIQMQTMQHEKSGLPDTSYVETPLLGSFIHQDDKPAMIDRAKDFIKRKFPKVNFAKIGPIGFSKKPGNDTTIVSFGAKGDKAQEKLKFNYNRQKKIGTQKEKAAQEVRDLRIRIERAQAKIDQLGSNVENESELRELQQRIKNYQTDFENAKKEVAALEKQAKQKAKEQTRVDQLRASLAAKESERNTLQERLNDTRALDDLKEKEAELKRQNEEDQAVIEDDNASPSEKQAAEERVAERTEELGRLQTQIAERERALPLRERIKEIFKKNGVTVTAIFLAAGVTIGAVIGAITNSLKATGKALGKGLSDVGSKVASALPGLIGSIVSFLFKTAGQAIGFLAKHTWLLILAAVAFLVEKYIKNRR